MMAPPMKAPTLLPAWAWVGANEPVAMMKVRAATAARVDLRALEVKVIGLSSREISGLFVCGVSMI